ncbi:SPOR domain-containing protein [Aquabacterium sp. J223]|uniref:SPOR domain-containing protein n=1 Tax=Aquabacterium sp. J223 TaxID=2898431 RepID=UPI0021ADD370|nr:SPOR domain-containing protein [Aquabacterium sp. J223]UUX95866.1 SPOR domain-containing protein [Aquabacterium sp. J223]
MRRPNQRGGFAIGLVVGLLIGLAAALAVALYVTKVPVPFVNKVPQRTSAQDAAEAERNKNWDPNAPLAGKPVRPALPAKPPADAGGPRPAEQPVAVAPSTVPGTPPAASAPRGARDPAALLSGQAPSAKPGSDPFSYFVQVGAYARADDAEQQRAKLAMLGLGARVTEREQAGRTVYRVRLGPFDGREDAEAAQSRAQAAGVEAALVRVER